jgi:hypothetical protein
LGIGTKIFLRFSLFKYFIVAEIEKKAIMLKMQAVEDFEINIFGE